MENNSINNVENVTEEQFFAVPEERSKPVNRFIRFIMSAGVVAAFCGYVSALFWFMNNSGV